MLARTKIVIGWLLMLIAGALAMAIFIDGNPYKLTFGIVSILCGIVGSILSSGRS